MKTLTFSYTKPDNSVSERTLLALVTPVDTFQGIDISELPPEKGAEFVRKYEDLHADFLAEVKELQAEYDLKFSYRTFKPERMHDVIEI